MNRDGGPLAPLRYVALADSGTSGTATRIWFDRGRFVGLLVEAVGAMGAVKRGAR